MDDSVPDYCRSKECEAKEILLEKLKPNQACLPTENATTTLAVISVDYMYQLRICLQKQKNRPISQ